MKNVLYVFNTLKLMIIVYNYNVNTFIMKIASNNGFKNKIYAPLVELFKQFDLFAIYNFQL